jgi:hypothetical protein
MNATNVIAVDFRRRTPATHVLMSARPPCACTLVYRMMASLTFAFGLWLACLAQLVWGWL